MAKLEHLFLCFNMEEEGSESSEDVSELFQQAAEWMRNNKTLKLSTTQKLSVYGLFKQVNHLVLVCVLSPLVKYSQGSEGPCNTDKPGIFDMTGRAKWWVHDSSSSIDVSIEMIASSSCRSRDAWHKLGKMEQLEAMMQYVALVKSLDPQWRSRIDKAPTVEGESKAKREGGGGGGGPVVSTLMNNDEVILDENKSIFDWCKEGQVERLSPLLSETNIGSTDEQVCSALVT